MRQTSSKAHTVTSNPAGYFEVRSGRSGQTYRVMPSATGLWALCECPSFRHRSRCSHVDAVIEFAKTVVPTPPVPPADPFARIEGRSPHRPLSSLPNARITTLVARPPQDLAETSDREVPALESEAK